MGVILGYDSCEHNRLRWVRTILLCSFRRALTTLKIIADGTSVGIRVLPYFIQDCSESNLVPAKLISSVGHL